MITTNAGQDFMEINMPILEWSALPHYIFIHLFFYQFFVVVKLQGDFTFIQSAKIKDFVNDLHVTGAPSSDSATSTYVRW